MKKILSAMQLLLFVPGLCISTAPYAAQQVTPSASNQQYAAPLETISYRASYNVSAPQTDTETGIGVRVHYDSSQLTPHNIQLHSTHAQPAGSPTADSEDFDNDANTDKYFILAWVNLDAQWPGSTSLPLELFNVDFTANAGFSGTTVNLSNSGTAENTDFQSSSQTYCVKPTLSVTSSAQNAAEGTADQPRFVIQAANTIPTACGEVRINHSITGNASAGSDYFTFLTDLSIPVEQNLVELPLEIIDDDQVESDESVILTLLPGDNYRLSNNFSASININNDDDQNNTLPAVNLSASKTAITENKSGSVLIYAERTSSNLSTPLEVFLQASGSASVGTDYLPPPPSIMIPANQEMGFAALIMKDDGDEEGTETLNLSIQPNANYRRGTSSALQLIISGDEVTQNTSLPISRTDSTDQNNPADNAANAKVTPVPTLSELMLLLMSLLLAGLAVLWVKNTEGQH